MHVYVRVFVTPCAYVFERACVFAFVCCMYAGAHINVHVSIHIGSIHSRARTHCHTQIPHYYGHMVRSMSGLVSIMYTPHKV